MSGENHPYTVYGAGGIIPLARAGRYTEDTGAGEKYITTLNALGARRVTARPGRARTWEIDSTGPIEWSRNLLALNSPAIRSYFWCTPYAQVHNLLPGGFAWARPGSPATTTDGALITVSSEASMPTPYTPVRPGEPVTAGVYGIGTGSLNLVFYDVAGQEVGRETASATHGQLERLTLTASAPARAVQARTSARGFIEMGGPSLTWTATPTPYAPPAGCAKAVITPTTHTPIHLVHSTPGSSLVNIKFTVQEVG